MATPLFESEYRRALFIRVSMVVATLMFAAIGYLLATGEGTSLPPEITADGHALWYVFYGVSVLLSVASIALRTFAHRPPAPQTATPQRLQTGEIIGGAFAEGIAVFGLVLTLLYHTLQPLNIMVGWSLVLQVITMPRRATWQRCLTPNPYDSGVPKIG